MMVRQLLASISLVACSFNLVAGVGFFQEGDSWDQVLNFQQQINKRLEQILREGFSSDQFQGSKVRGDLIDANGIPTWQVSQRGKLSGYQQLVLIQEQMRLDKVKNSRVDNKLQDQFFGVLDNLRLSKPLMKFPSSSFSQKVKQVNEFLDGQLEKIAEDNYLHTITGGMEMPSHAILGIHFDSIFDLMKIQDQRCCRRDDELSTPTDFGRLVGVDDLSSDSYEDNIGFQYFRDTFRVFFGDMWAWAALKIMKEDIKIDLLAGRFDYACRRSATIQCILDKASYVDVTPEAGDKKYYRNFYTELAWVEASTAPDMVAAKNLNYRYLQLDESKGSATDRRAKREINGLLRDVGEVMTLQNWKSPDVYAYVALTETMDKYNSKKGLTAKAQYWLTRHKGTILNWAENKNYESVRAGSANQTVEKILQEIGLTAEQSSNAAKAFTNMKDYCKDMMSRKFRSERDVKVDEQKLQLTTTELTFAESILDVYQNLNKINYGFLVESHRLPANVFQESQNGSTDGEFGNSCFFYSTSNNLASIARNYARRWCSNMWKLSGKDVGELNGWVNQEKILDNSMVNSPNQADWNYLLHRNQVSFQHSDKYCPLTQNGQTFDGSRCFNSKLGNGSTINIDDFLKKGVLSEKIEICDRANPVLVNRFFYNRSNSHFIGVAPKRDHEEVLANATLQQKMTLLYGDPNNVVNWLYYLLYGTPFTHRTVDERGDWNDLLPNKTVDHGRRKDKIDRIEWESRFIAY